MARRSTGEGSLHHRKDGRWQASLQVDGKRVTRYGLTRSEALAKLDALRQQVSKAGLLPNPRKHTVGELMEAWLASRAQTLKPRTLADYRATIDRYITPALGSLTLEKVTPRRLVALYAHWQEQGKHRTALRIHRALSMAFALAVRWAWLAASPCDKLDPPRYKPERKDVWTLAEMRRFLDGTRDHWLSPLWLCAIATGCRLGELLALTWDDVDWNAGTIAIDKSAQMIGGKRVTGTPKTASGNRTISVPPDALAKLRQHKIKQAAQRVALRERWQAGDFVFSSPRGNALRKTTVEAATRRECDRLGLPRQTPHQLRHLHASVLISRGLPVTDVSRRLGHATPAITMAIYAHALGDDDQAAANAIGHAMGG